MSTVEPLFIEGNQLVGGELEIGILVVSVNMGLEAGLSSRGSYVAMRFMCYDNDGSDCIPFPLISSPLQFNLY